MTIAREIAERVKREAEKAKASSVTSIDIEVGDLAFFDASSIELWLQQALANGPAKDAKVRIDVVASTLTCRGCGFRGAPQLPEYHNHHLPLPPLNCPRCDSPDVELEAKRDLILKRIELEV